MTYYDFDELVGELTPEQRARVEALKEQARAETVAYTLKELRQRRNLTQTELARRLDRAQASVSAMETAADNLVSTLRMAVEGMGGYLEVTAVFDNERIPLTANTRTAHQDHEERSDAWFAMFRTAIHPASSKHAQEQSEARRLLADLGNRLQESEDTYRALMQRLATDTSDQASSQPATSA
jgi:transcriptional regulator with XRE-family HTH domain